MLTCVGAAGSDSRFIRRILRPRAPSSQTCSNWPPTTRLARHPAWSSKRRTAATLEVLLPYIYPRSVLDAYLSFPRDWTLVRACDKYSVWRAIEALRSSLTGAFFFQPNSQVLTMCGRSSTSAGRVLMVAYIFACHFGFDKLASQAVEQLAVQGSFSQTCASLSRNQPELLISAADATNLVRPFFVAPGGKSIDLVAAFSLRG